MPQNLTGNGTSFVTQTAPVAGDPRTVSSIVVPLQAAADRAEYLKTHVDALEAGGRKIRYFVSNATLKASTDHVDNEIILLKNKGIYRYDAASSDTDDGVGAITPNDVGGNGRWLSQRINFNVSDPLTVVDLNPLAVTGTYATKQTFSNSFTQGDKILLDVHVRGALISGAGGDSLEVYINVSGPSFSQDSEAIVLCLANAATNFHDNSVTFPMVIPIATTGTYTINVKARTTGSPASAQIGFARYRALVVN